MGQNTSIMHSQDERTTIALQYGTYLMSILHLVCCQELKKKKYHRKNASPLSPLPYLWLKFHQNWRYLIFQGAEAPY